MSTTEEETRTEVDEAAVAEASAREKGWVPKEEFRGDQSKWVDAPQYLQINGHLRNDRDRVRADLDQVRQQNANLAAQLRAQQAALDALQTEVVETKTTDLAATEAELTAQIREARKADDFDLEESLRDKREEVRRQKLGLTVDKAKPSAQATGGGASAVESPEFKQFLHDNPWFETDRVMAAASVAILSELNASGATKDLTPGQRYTLAAQKTKERFGMQEGRGASKMEGSRGGADAGGGDGTGKSYADLPSDARTACDKLSSRVVGPGKKFKTEAEWRKSYTTTYFK